MDVRLMQSVTSLMATPRKRPAPSRSDLDDGSLVTPSKSRRCGLSGARGSAEPAKSPPSAATGASSSATGPAELPQREVLLRLFAGLEVVLMHLQHRGRRAWVPVVRRDVEAATGRSLTDERLGQILAVAGGMLEAAWADLDDGSQLELLQRAADGSTLEPTIAELSKRRQRFFDDLAATATIPTRSVERLAAAAFQQPPRVAAGAAAEGRPADIGSGGGGSVGGSATAAAGRGGGLSALRSRVLARQDSDGILAERRRALAELSRRVSACEDALVALEVVEFLLAREEGCEASEAEAVATLSSRSRSMQCKKPMDAEVARAAVATLSSVSSGWLSVVPAKHSRTSGYFMRRVEGGSSARVRQALDAQLRGLRSERDALHRSTLSTPVASTPTAPQRRRRVTSKRAQ